MFDSDEYKYICDFVIGQNNLYFVRDSKGGIYVAKRYKRKSLQLNEASILKTIYKDSNKNIIKLLSDYPESQSNVLEYIPGETLSDIMEEKPKRVKKEVILKLIEILEHIHAKSIVYCDLKPSNIIVSGNDVVLIDFDRSFNMNDFHGYGFSLDYSPKEVQFELPCFQSDIWSLGIIMYEMYTGRTPFSKYNSELTVKEAIKRGHIDFTCINDKSLFDLLSKMLVVDPKKRISLHDVKSHEYFILRS